MNYFKKIPRNRLIAYILVLGLLPIFFMTMHVMTLHKAIDEAEEHLTFVQELALIRETKQAHNLAVRAHYREADHFYLDKSIESLVFLEPEIESLQKIMNQNNFVEDEAIKKRLEFLNQHNALGFTEGALQTSPYFQEVVETQVHPVEINGIDLQKILTRIEGVEMGSSKLSPNRPQLVILDFRLDRKKVSEKNEVFHLNLKLLKREFL